MIELGQHEITTLAMICRMTDMKATNRGSPYAGGVATEILFLERGYITKESVVHPTERLDEDGKPLHVVRYFITDAGRKVLSSR